MFISHDFFKINCFCHLSVTVTIDIVPLHFTFNQKYKKQIFKEVKLRSNNDSTNQSQFNFLVLKMNMI